MVSVKMYTIFLCFQKENFGEVKVSLRKVYFTATATLRDFTFLFK